VNAAVFWAEILKQGLPHIMAQYKHL